MSTTLATPLSLTLMLCLMGGVAQGGAIKAQYEILEDRWVADFEVQGQRLPTSSALGVFEYWDFPGVGTRVEGTVLTEPEASRLVSKGERGISTGGKWSVTRVGMAGATLELRLDGTPRQSLPTWQLWDFPMSSPLDAYAYGAWWRYHSPVPGVAVDLWNEPAYREFRQRPLSKPESVSFPAPPFTATVWRAPDSPLPLRMALSIPRQDADGVAVEERHDFLYADWRSVEGEDYPSEITRTIWLGEDLLQTTTIRVTSIEAIDTADAPADAGLFRATPGPVRVIDGRPKAGAGGSFMDLADGRPAELLKALGPEGNPAAE